MTLDIAIRGAAVVDGSGAPRYRADVGVRGGRIAEIGRIREPAARTIDADGPILAPGFIDGATGAGARRASGTIQAPRRQARWTAHAGPCRLVCVPTGGNTANAYRYAMLFGAGAP